MAKTTENIEGQQAQDQQQPPQSARDRYLDRYRAAHPDLNIDDEEAMYTQANANLDELEDLRKSNKELGKALDDTPILGGLLLAARNGVNPFTYLAENIGPDMDIRELAANPDFAKQMGEALLKFQENQAKAAEEKAEAEKRDAEYKKQVGENMAKSFETLKALQQEKGLSDEEVLKMVKDFFGELDEEGKPTGKDSFMQLASNGIVTKGMWQALFNDRHHDGDIADATEKARAQALNEKVQNPKKNFGGSGVPSLGSGGAGRRGEGKKDDGSLKSFGESLVM